MDIITGKSANIDFEPKIQRQRISKVSHYNAKVSLSRNGEDHLTLSDKAIEFREIKDMLEQIPDVRQDKVIRLSEKIKQGEYNIDSKKVAEEILMEELSLARIF